MSKRECCASVIAVLLAASCGAAELPCPDKDKAPEFPAVVKQLVAGVKQHVRMIDMEAFKEVLAREAGQLVLDVREPCEYAKGHVAGATNLPRGVVEFKVWKLVGFPRETNTATRIYVYCKRGGRAVLAAKALEAVGFSDVTAVDMKYADWEKAALPVERGGGFGAADGEDAP